jgi:molecular chaperone GrpE
MKKKKDKSAKQNNEAMTEEKTGFTDEAESIQTDSPKHKECCQEQIELMSDKYLRLLAEFDNFKKRTFKEKEELYKTASSKIITAILPVLDDIDRAINTVVVNEGNKPLIEGLDLISKKFRTILHQHGLELMICLGEDFNTDYHEALTIVEVDHEQKGKVIEEIEKGYLLNGHVIRFAKVVVGK